MSSSLPAWANDDLDIARLLQQTGSRDTPALQLQAEVETAVHAAWLDVVQKRKQHRNRIAGFSLAASVAIVMCTALLVMKATQPTAITVATIEHIDGRLIASSSDGPTPSIAAGEGVMSGESLRTDHSSRAALRWPSGLSVRLDHDTAIRIASGTRIVLISGSIYIDAAPDHAEPLAIESSFGAVRHLGTQYMVSVHPNSLDVSVREGRVSIDHGATALVGIAGERIKLTGSGAVERTALTASDSSWSWTTAAAPAFQIDNQSLAAFLEWMARESGRRLVFESPQAKSAATRVILRGSIDGLDLDTALSVVLSTTKLHRYETKDDSIGIALNND